MDTKECFKTKDECIQRNFNIFNNFCYEQCPTNTEIKNNDNICYCIYHYLNESNVLTCFNFNETCESKGYPYINVDTKECFNLINDCINRGFKTFNNICYNNCPTNTKEKDDDSSNCICSIMVS